MLDRITVHGARQHNLKNISVEIPRNTFTVITGLSGSGKSSLAFDTIYAEGQRRYVETLSPYARQFLDQMERPEVDSIDGLSPAISIEQKTTSRSPRSTVGTVTEIYDYLRLLYASVGVPHCPVCGAEIARQSPAQILEQVFGQHQNERIMIMAPIARGRKGEYKKELEAVAKAGFRARIDGEMRTLEEPVKLDKRKNHTIEVVIDRLVVKPGIEQRLESSIQTALKWADGIVIVSVMDGPERLYSEKLACPNDGTSIPQLEPRSFSFNSPYGACETCNGVGSTWAFDAVKVICDPGKPLLDGGLGPGSSSSYMTSALNEAAEKFGIDLSIAFEELPKKTRTLLVYGNAQFPGILKLLDDSYSRASEGYRDWLMDYMSPTLCPECKGQRLKPASLAVQVKGASIAEFTALPIARALPLAKQWEFTGRELKVVGRVIEEIQNRLQFLCAVGLDYLSLERSSATLSGGEAQRIRLATQIGSKLRGVLYVLDEPSIGLHPRDNGRLLDTLHHLRDLGNTVLVVEHDAETIERADYVIDLGPRAGRLGGSLMAQGTPAQIMKMPESLTGKYLSGHTAIVPPAVRRRGNGLKITVKGAREHNLKNVDAEFPLGTFTVVTGVSGSGKSTLVHDILYRALAKEVYGSSQAGAHDKVLGLENIDKVIEIDQSPIGRTPRSNPATYTGVFTAIREIYAMLPESRERGYKAGRFSFNVKGGRCEACQGDGLKRIEMNFLPDVYVTCDVCRGRRYNLETLQVKYKGKSIADLLESSVTDSVDILANLPQIQAKLKTLSEVGLGYLHLGQSSTTLSGGEAQRIKLAKELSKRQTGKTFYLLDEPTTGLHFEDVRHLLEVLQRLVDLGNTVLVIEHHLDVIKSADYLIDLGPEGGEQGGYIVAAGTPDEVMANRRSHTGEALRKVAKAGMLPEEPQLPVAEPGGESGAEVAPAREPFWGYMDLALVLGLLTAAVAVILVALGLLVRLHPELRDDPAPLALPLQFGLYAVIYVCFRLVFGLRYGQPVFRSLGWRRSGFNLVGAGVGGVVLAIGVAGLASLLHTPKVPSPVDKLVNTPLSFAMVGLLAVIAAPLFEELLFRGFLQPLFSRTLGMVAGILVTAVLFGSLHAQEYSWAWQYVAAISVAGAVFGWVRARANSIIPSTVMHGCFNAVSVIALAITKYTPYKLDT